MARAGRPAACREETPTAEHPNVAFIKRGFDAFNTADIGTLTELIDENAVQHMGGGNVYGRIGEASGGTFRADPEQIWANDHRVVVYRASAEREGRFLDMRNAIVFEIRNGKIADITDVPADADEQDAFWS